MLLKRFHRTASSAALQGADALADAARAAYQKALNEHLPLAHIAEQSGHPQYWFANNILQVIDVYGKSPDEAGHGRLTREITSGLKLVDDMSALIAPGETRPRFVELLVTKEEFERYMAWARSVY
ncbi:MAG: hypothetical protein KGJ79_15775 [Alphaproteobacteria bacterium]|nr:hypothetical protein [Alphaproteobacteria bacterium]MDE2494085.1 hypothetical protein [Alphaproteobacteria bacterium]